PILGLQLIGIAIAPLGNSGGRTSFEQDQGRLVTREELERQITMMLSGNAAEAVLLGSASIGSGGERGSDLAKAPARTFSCEPNSPVRIWGRNAGGSFSVKI